MNMSQIRGALTTAVCDAYREAVISLPMEVRSLIKRAADLESNPLARAELENILENCDLAERLRIPLCQDTGVPLVYLTLPPTIPYTQEIYDAVAAGIVQATETIPLRPNVVDPLSRKNRGNNIGVGMPHVHISAGERCEVTVMPKGAGAENASRIVMLLPSEKDQIERVLIETVLLAGARACPPLILGVGIGGTFDSAAALAKSALLLPLETMTSFEEELCMAINKLGIGPMGLGGKTTALSVKVKIADCHTASLPVAVNLQCWAHRHARREVLI